MAFNKLYLLVCLINISGSFATWFRADDGISCTNLSVSHGGKLPNFNLIGRFELDLKPELIASESSLTAYRLNRDSQFAISTSDVFKDGSLNQFSFSCTFRKQIEDNRAWTLLRINDFDSNPQFGLTINTNQDRIELYFPEKNKHIDSTIGIDHDYYNTANVLEVQLLKFNNIRLTKGGWNKIDISVFPNNVTLFINCKMHSTLALNPTSAIDLLGDIWLAKYDDDFSTVPLDIQQMQINCDATAPLSDSCQEISNLYKTREQFTILKEEKCCRYLRNEIEDLVLKLLTEKLPSFAKQFKGPQGKPGKCRFGLQGPPGQKGETGNDGQRGFYGLQGSPGVNGLPGPKGDKGNAGYKGNKGDRGLQGVKGNLGKPGQIGPTGFGVPGSKGERGSTGSTGVQGIRGPQGPIGSPGTCESCKTLNMDTLQLLMSQNQRQIKGP